MSINDRPETIASAVSGLASAWRLMEAEEFAAAALAKHPRSTPLIYAHAFGLLRQGRVNECVEVLRRALTREPHEVNLCILNAFASNYDPRASASEVASAHLRVGAAFRRVVGTPARLESTFRLGARPVRVGLLSADLYRHSVAYFLEPLLAHLPRDRVEVVALDSSRVSDAVTNRLRARVSAWHDLADLSHDAFADAARAMSLDIALDLSGLTAFHRLRALATRIAPVQASYLGYPHACGLDTVTTRIADHATDPEDAPNRMAERIVRLDGCFLCYQPPDDAPPIRAKGQERGGIVFGSFGNLAKINRPLVMAWSRVLDAVPGSRLVLKNHALADARLRGALPARFRSWGIDPSRVEFCEPPPNERDHLDAYNDIDIALDTFPYHGTTTTCEALLMGVPVVTWAGDRHASRVGRSLLSAAGFGSWCGESEDRFVTIAIELASGGPRDVPRRTELRERVLASSLCDARRHAALLATALEEIGSGTT